MTTVGKKFPNLDVNAIKAGSNTYKLNVLEEAINNKKKVLLFWYPKVLLFWYPKDFTFVCPTELHAFQEAVAELEKRNTIVIGASCDTAEVHFAWLNTPKKNGGIEGVKYPLIADSNRNLATVLGILDSANEEYNEELDAILVDGDAVTYRATYLIDEEGKVFHASVNDMPLGRNVNEYLRLIDAYSHVQKYGEVPNAEGTAEYLSKH